MPCEMGDEKPINFDFYFYQNYENSVSTSSRQLSLRELKSLPMYPYPYNKKYYTCSGFELDLSTISERSSNPSDEVAFSISNEPFTTSNTSFESINSISCRSTHSIAKSCGNSNSYTTDRTTYIAIESFRTDTALVTRRSGDDGNRANNKTDWHSNCILWPFKCIFKRRKKI